MSSAIVWARVGTDFDIRVHMAEAQKRLHLVFNANSGKGAASILAQNAEELCREHGYELHLYPVESSQEFDSTARRAADKARLDQGLLAAAGGDGTIRGVAQIASEKNVRFAVIPCGTFNFFARTHGIPEDPLEALRLALNGETRPVRLGEVNGHVFLINASLGIYERAIRERESHTSRWGRNRLVVILSTILTFLNHNYLLRVDLESNGKVSSLQSAMIFIGNNALQLRNLSLSVAQCMKNDLLALVILNPLSKLEVLRVIFRGIFKTLENEQSLSTFCIDELTIRSRHARPSIALDGEIFHVTNPIRVRSRPNALKMVLPPEKSAEKGAESHEAVPNRPTL